MDELLQAIPRWVEEHSTIMWTVAVVSAAAFVGSLVAMPFLLSWIPEDYFLRPPGAPATVWLGRHPLLELILRGTRNLVGLLFIIAGISMLVLPGQGLLTILAGLVLLELPGKRDLEVSLLRRPQIFRAVNWLRKQRNHPPLRLPPPRRRTSASDDA